MRKIRYQIFVQVICAILCLFQNVLAQNGTLHFTTLTSKEGLPSNTINAILKDKYGLLWFATQDGLAKFNGINFSTYRHLVNDTASLLGNEISSLHEDRKGRLWIGTNKGLNLYNRHSDSFTQYKGKLFGVGSSGGNIKGICSDRKGNIWVASLGGLNVLNPVTRQITKFIDDKSAPWELESGEVICVYADSQGIIWIGTKNGLFNYNSTQERFTAFKHHENDPESICGDLVKTIVEDRSGGLWIGTSNGLSHYDRSRHRFTNIYQNSTPDHLSNNTIYSLSMANTQSLWIGTENGLDVLDIKSKKISHYYPLGRDLSSISGRSIRSILNDRDGISWVGTYDAGVNKFDRNLTFFSLQKHNPYDLFSLPAPFVTALTESENNKVYVGTDGGGLCLYHPETKLFDRISLKGKQNELSDLKILALEKSKNGLLWIGTYQTGLFQFDPVSGEVEHYVKGNTDHSLNNDEIFCLKEDKQGRLWVGTNGGGVNVYDPATRSFHKYGPPADGQGMIYLPSNGYIRAFLEDKQGKMWIGSYGTGITIYDPAKKNFEILNRFNRSFPNAIVNTFLEDRKGNMWVGTGGDGLLRISPDRKSIKVFDFKDGLADGVIHKIIEDLEGRIWVSTNKGVSWINTSKGKLVNYSYYNGLQNTSFKNGAGLITANGMIYFGGGEGLNFIDPKTIRHNFRHPVIIFTELKVNNKIIGGDDRDVIDHDISIAKIVKLSYKQNFSISFVALNFTSPLQNHYYYRLKGFDKDWINSGSKNTVAYTNLSPGKYTLEVKASNNDGIWSKDTASLEIYIKPPFWMTVWAYLFYVTAACSFLLLIRYRGIRKLKSEFHQQQLQKEAERLQELDKHKTKFFTNLSHDLRTPISLIMGPVENLVNENNLDSESLVQLKLVKRNTRRLLNLVNQLLDFRKIEEHEFKLNLKTRDIISFIREVCESFQELSEKKQILLTINTAVKYLEIPFDADKLERIIFNLLSNAFKFNYQGGKVSLNAFIAYGSAGDTQDALILEISDTGVGIDKESLPHIFDRFYQSKSSDLVADQGSGIGLSIVKEFVLQHDGIITVDSIEGEGTIFRIKLPIKIGDYEHGKGGYEKFSTVSVTDSETEVLQNSVVKVTESLKKTPLILIVEDHEDFRFFLKNNLEKQYHIMEATNGREGWQKALALHPDLIVSDIMMPVMNGSELCSKLKSDKRTMHIPVILLTASTGEENQIKGLASGANDYLNKPFSFEVLDVRIKNLLNYNQTLIDTYVKQVKISTSEPVVESVNEIFLRSVVQYVEDNLTNTQLSVEDMSRHLGVSRGTLYYKLLEITGKSPVEFLRSLKLEKAAMLLENSDLNISEIAYKVGFATPNYFAKTFKIKYGVLPSEYVFQNRKQAKTKTDTNSPTTSNLPDQL